MKILITGANGYIGSHLADYLSTTEHGIFKWPDHTDISDEREVNRVFGEIMPDVVIHCAALVSTRLCDVARQYAYKVNVEGSKYIARAANECSANLIYIGTTASYKPTQERITERTPIEPITLYGLTKYLGEEEARRECKKNVTLRFCFCFGQSDRVSGISQMIKAYKDDRPVVLEMSPRAYKDYMHVTDFCRAVEAVIECGEYTGEIYNISQQTPTTLQNIVDMLYEMEIRPIIYFRPEADYMFDHIVDSTKFRKRYGWKPRGNLKQNISECL